MVGVDLTQQLVNVRKMTDELKRPSLLLRPEYTCAAKLMQLSSFI